MRNQSHSAVFFALAAAGLGALVACERSRTNGYQMDSAAGTVVDEAEWIRDSVRTDALIIGALHETHEMEIDASQAARVRASDSEVRMFATEMIADHKRLDERADSLAKVLEISRQNPPDAVEDKHDREIDSLRMIGKDTGTIASAFDRAFMEQQVKAHRSVLDLVDVAIERAQRPQLKAALQNEVRPAVVSHLQRAQAIQKRIGG